MVLEKEEIKKNDKDDLALVFTYNGMKESMSCGVLEKKLSRMFLLRKHKVEISEIILIV